MIPAILMAKRHAHSDGQETCSRSISLDARARAVPVRPLNVTSRKQETSSVGKMADKKNSDFAKVKLFLLDASQQPSVARDVDKTFICDANGEV